MKRKVALRKLKRTCYKCGCGFNKGEVYYKFRSVYAGSKVSAYEWILCAKCKRKQEQHKKRFEIFKKNCHHPIKTLVWDYIPGECVMQPDHNECLVCGEWVR